MTDRERELLNYIKEDPMISQSELAKRMKITRSSVSVHISNLMKKGYIKGKGYVVSEAGDDVVVIGGANMDITGVLSEQHHIGDSNPGKITMSFGGVGRNIAENLAHLGLNVYLMTALGDDVYGHEIHEKSVAANINMSMTKIFGNQRTSVYMQLVDSKGNLNLAVSDMEITDFITVEDLIEQEKILNRAKVIVTDGNMSSDVIGYLSENYGHKLFFEPVSIAKAIKIKPFLNHVYCITPNIAEAKIIYGHDLEEDQLVDQLYRKGVKMPVITLGEKGIAYYEDRVRKKDALSAEIINVTGAGDALMSGLVYGFMKNHTLDMTMEYGLKMAKMALESRHAVNRNIKQIELD